MNINDLTIGQAKAISSLIKNETISAIDNGMIGKYVIVRCLNSGVFSGVLEQSNGSECLIRAGRRLWYHQPAVKTSSWYEGVSIHGLSNESKTSAPVERRHLTDVLEIIGCTARAETNIQNAPEHEQE